MIPTNRAPLIFCDPMPILPILRQNPCWTFWRIWDVKSFRMHSTYWDPSFQANPKQRVTIGNAQRKTRLTVLGFPCILQFHNKSQIRRSGPSVWVHPSLIIVLLGHLTGDPLKPPRCSKKTLVAGVSRGALVLLVSVWRRQSNQTIPLSNPWFCSFHRK